MPSQSPCIVKEGKQMADKAVVLERTGSIAFLTLSAPPKNEMGTAFFRELTGLTPELQRLEAKGMIVRGQGRHFSSGANLEELKAMVSRAPACKGMRALLDNSDAFALLSSLRFPVVAAIAGCCLGSGLELALACTFRVAARNAVLGVPEASFGLMPGCGGTVRLTHLVGYQKAIELIVTGNILLAPDALEAGLVDAVVDKHDLENTAIRFVDALGDDRCLCRRSLS
jgi:enoyl-CoA hydratase/carnithine racemase